MCSLSLLLVCARLCIFFWLFVSSFGFSHKKFKTLVAPSARIYTQHSTHTRNVLVTLLCTHLCLWCGHCTRCLSFLRLLKDRHTEPESVSGQIGAQLVLCFYSLSSRHIQASAVNIVSSYQIKSEKLANSELSIECAPFVSGTYIAEWFDLLLLFPVLVRACLQFDRFDRSTWHFFLLKRISWFFFHYLCSCFEFDATSIRQKNNSV